MASSDSTETPSTEDKLRRPSFCILIDPPHADWWRSSSALIFALQAQANLITQINPWDARPGELATLMQALASPLCLVADELAMRMNDGTDVDHVLRAYLTSDEYTAKIEKRAGGES